LNLYEKLLGKVLKGRRPYKILYGTIGLFVVVFILWGIAGPPIVFFPNNEPNNVYVYLKLPEGTSISYTDSVTKVAEKKIYQTLGEKNINIKQALPCSKGGIRIKVRQYNSNLNKARKHQIWSSLPKVKEACRPAAI
jgi:multidrug efflux pump subunit AcrB